MTTTSAIDVVSSGTLSILVHAHAKQGKSTLGSTAPPPILVLDVEGSWRFIHEFGYRSGIPLRTKAWNPDRDPPPRYDGTWEICHVTVREWRTLTNTYNWLARMEHDFRSVELDSITEAQRKLKTNLRGTEAMQMQDWGSLLVQMDKLIRDFRDLTLIPGSPVQVVVFVAETRQDAGKWRPYMQGQISVSLPYWVDLVGFLYTDYGPDVNQQLTIPYKRLWIGDHAQFEAGERVQGRLGTCVDDPNITTMLNTVFAGTPLIPALSTAQEDSK